MVDTSCQDVAPEFIDQFVEELLKVPARSWRGILARLLKYDDVAELTRITAPRLVPQSIGRGERVPFLPYPPDETSRR